MNETKAAPVLPSNLRAIAFGLRSLRAILGSDAEKHAVVLSGHYVLDASGYDLYSANPRKASELLAVRKAFLDIVEGK